MRPAFLALLSVLVLQATAAATDLSVFGFEFGQPLVLPECPYTRLPNDGYKMYRESMPDLTCVRDAHRTNGYAWPARTVMFGKSEAPPIVQYWRFVALEKAGRLIGIEFWTPGAGAQDIVMDQLRAKYGDPTTFSTERVGNLMGATFDSITAAWRGGDVDVTFYGTESKITQGHVIIDLPIATALRRRWETSEHRNERKL